MLFNDQITDLIGLIALPLEMAGFVLTFIEVIFPNTADAIERIIDNIGNYSRRFGKDLVSTVFKSNAFQFLYLLAVILAIVLVFTLLILKTNPVIGDHQIPFIRISFYMGLLSMSLQFTFPRNFLILRVIYLLFSNNTRIEFKKTRKIIKILIFFIPLILVIISDITSIISAHYTFYVMSYIVGGFIFLISTPLFIIPSMFIAFLNKLTNGRALGSVGLIIAFLGLTCEAYQVFVR